MTEGEDTKAKLYCSFCGKSQKEVRKLVAGPTVFICDECIDICNAIVAEETTEETVQIDAELAKDPRKLLDIPVDRDAFNSVTGSLADQGQRRGWRLSGRELVLQAIHLYARHIVRRRLNLDSKLLQFKKERDAIT